MSTKNVVGDNIVNPVTASWYYVSESKGKPAGKIRGTLAAVSAWIEFQLSRLTSHLFNESQASTVLAPVPLRNAKRGNGPWR